MINIILILLILNTLFFTRTTLYCGLFGWVGELTESFNLSNIKILGILNDSRGGDGYGIFNGKKVFKFITPRTFKEGLKDYTNLKSSIIPNLRMYLGHTRKKSSGNIDLEHTQPILIKTNNVTIVVLHNGTIYNMKELYASHNESKTYDKYSSNSDTQLLARLFLLEIEKNNNIKSILEQYKGSASLVIWYSLKPNSVYLFRGESKNYNSNIMTMERPLFVMEEINKGFYFSSLKDPLEYIKGENFNPPYQLKANCVYEITGKSINKILTIDRSKSFQSKYSSNNNFYNYNDYDNYNNDWYLNKNKTQKTIGFKPVETPKYLKNNLPEKASLDHLSVFFLSVTELMSKFSDNIILVLDYIAKAFDSKSIINTTDYTISTYNDYSIIFYRGRYIKIKRLKGKIITSEFANGAFLITKTGIIKNYYSSEIKKYYFVHGIHVKESNFKPLLKFFEGYSSSYVINPLLDFFESYTSNLKLNQIISLISEPIIVFSNDKGLLINLNSEGIINHYTGTFMPLFTNIQYYIYNGIVKSSKKNDQYSKPLDFNFINNTASDILIKCPKCNASDNKCIICYGNGYISKSENNKYLNTQKNKQKDQNLDMQLAIIEPQIDLETVSIIKNIGVQIENSVNEIELLGQKTDFSSKSTAILLEIENDLIELLDYGTK